MKLLRKTIEWMRKRPTEAKAVKPSWQDLWRQENTLHLPDSVQIRGRIYIRRAGSGNVLSFGENAAFKGKLVVTGNNNRIIIGRNANYRGDILVKGDNQTVTIGDFSTTVGVYILCAEGCDVTIGHSCMFSRAIEIRTTDAHSVIDRETGIRLNRAASITIGDHVWCGLGTIINKGARVPSDSIIGAMSFVRSRFDEEGTVIAGTPAQVVKRGITWHRAQHDHYRPEEMNRWRRRGVAKKAEYLPANDSIDFPQIEEMTGQAPGVKEIPQRPASQMQG